MSEQYSLSEIIGAQELLEKGVDKILNNVVEKIYGGELNEGNIESFKKFHNNFHSTYYNMKKEFDETERISGERYFEHLREVVNNVLDLPNPNLEKVLIAITHDAIEDRPEIDFKYISTLTNHSGQIKGQHVALAVQAISKEPSENYQEEGDTKEDAKAKRNKAYFGHMKSFKTMKNHIQSVAEEKGLSISEEELLKITQDAIDVKLADRIHNLSTQWDPKKTEWVQGKVNETKQYFLPLAKEVNKVTHEKLNSLVLKLKMQLHNASGKSEKILTA